jgi:hypothetical protein
MSDEADSGGISHRVWTLALGIMFISLLSVAISVIGLSQSFSERSNRSGQTDQIAKMIQDLSVRVDELKRRCDLLEKQRKADISAAKRL